MTQNRTGSLDPLLTLHNRGVVKSWSCLNKCRGRQVCLGVLVTTPGGLRRTGDNQESTWRCRQQAWECWQPAWEQWQLVLAMGPNSRVGSRSGSNPEPDRWNGFYHTQTWTVAIGLVLPPKTRHFNLPTVTPIKYLSSDRIVIRSVYRLCNICRFITWWFQNCDATNIRCVAVENPRILHQIWCYFTAAQPILVASQFWMQEVKELLKLHNLHTDHVMIQSEPKNLIGAKALPKW